ncbi:amidohydrolase family protein [Pseudonocardia nigra]|uniref:amidohydrolase family protein n=1 Tax=Pseudonocardia nigra TaxID=1921578 RepID=UPI001C600CA5|nr:amidohydrolase family protein [Pseudonocardia nigra]
MSEPASESSARRKLASGSSAQPAPRIDAHHHFWQVARQEQPWRGDAHAGLAADFEPADLAPQLDAAGVDATVLVESVDTPAENDLLAGYAAAFPRVAGVVGWLPLADAAAARAELARADRGRWCGVRCLVGRAPLSWLADAEAVALFTELADEGLAWDVVPVTDGQADAVVALARAVPGLRIVVDHLARPPLDTGVADGWRARVDALSACPNVAMKVSVGIDVLTAWPAWRPADLTPYVAHAVDRFGAERLMLASNWPVVTLRADYGAAVRDLDAAVVACGLDAAGLAEVRGGTAARWYALRT